MRRGFTLIELLVVIAIIAILAAILFPVFARARAKARQTSCLSNVKETMLGVLMYVQDYGETWPVAYNWPGSAGYWYNVIQPYLKNKQILICPSYGPGSNHGGRPDCSYGWNIYGTGSGHWGMGYYYGSYRTGYSGPLRDADIPEPARTICIGDCRDASYGGNGLYSIGYSSFAYMPTVHNEGGNFGFCDGHAKWYSAQAIYQSDLWDIIK